MVSHIPLLPCRLKSLNPSIDFLCSIILVTFFHCKTASPFVSYFKLIIVCERTLRLSNGRLVSFRALVERPCQKQSEMQKLPLLAYCLLLTEL